MNAPRELTAAERRGVNRVERALASVDLDTLAFYFTDGGFNVYDRQVWISRPEGGPIWHAENELDGRRIRVHHDTGSA